MCYPDSDYYTTFLFQRLHPVNRAILVFGFLLRSESLRPV